MAKRQGLGGFRPKLISIAVASCFVAGAAYSAQPVLPTGAVPVIGIQSINQVNNTLNIITNTQRSIANFTTFSVGADAAVRISQPSTTSGFLSRVTGGVPSEILGSVWSNGRFYLINTSGILFGAGAQVDVAGLVASSLNLSNADFLANRLKFSEVAGAGSVVNQGNINTSSGGNVYLAGPAVTNSGIITSPNGEVILAAGNSVTLVDAGTPNLQVEINAPDNQAVNLGQIMVDSGRAGIYAGLIKQAGVIRADSVVAGEGGQIKLVATKNATLEAGSVTTANGQSGGSVTVQSGDTTLVAGAIEATGSATQGGTVQVLGYQVGLIGDASVNVSGETGGGKLLVGGDFQGNNPDVQNAFRTYVGPDTTIKADALTSGDGGKVIVWSDDATRFYGTISIKGGTQSGDGGFAEVSGKNYLDYSGLTIASAAKGRSGTLLLDPQNVIINDAGNPAGGLDDGSFDGEEFFLSGPGPSFIKWATIQNQLAPLGGDSNAVITTTGAQCATAVTCGDITIVTHSPDLATPNALSLLANRDILVGPPGLGNGSVTNTGTGGLSLYAGWITTSGIVTPSVGIGGGSIVLSGAINYPNSTVKLVAAGGIAQDGVTPGAITALNLLALARSGSVMLDQTPNFVGTLAGSADGGASSTTEFRFTNGQPLVIGSVDEGGAFGVINGVTVDTFRPTVVNINVTSGNLTVNKNITSRASGSSDAATIALQAAGAIAINGAAVLAQGGSGEVGGSATVTLNAGTGITVNNSSIEALAGAGSCCGAGADATLNMFAGGNIDLLNVSTINVAGGDAGSGSGAGGNGFALLSAGGAINVNSGSSINVAGGKGGDAFSSIGMAAANGGLAQLIVSASGDVTMDGDIAVTSGAGGIANAPGTGADTGGGGAFVSINAGGALSVGGNIAATGGMGGTATGASAVAGGGYGQVNLQANGITVNGNVSAAGGAAGLANSAADFGGDGFVSLRTYGPITVAGNLTATGGAGGSGGAATISLSIPFAQCEGPCPPPPPTGAGLFSGALTATGGDGTSGGGFAGVFVGNFNSITVNGGTLESVGGTGAFGGYATTALFSNTTITGTNATIEAYAGNGGVGSVDLSAAGSITLNSGTIEAEVGCAPPSCSGGASVNIFSSGGNIDLGATDISAIGETAAAITIDAPNGYIHNISGVLTANDIVTGGLSSTISLTALNGIGTQANPIRLQKDVDLSVENSASGDLAISFVTGNIVVDGDFSNFGNGNPNGLYFARIENGNFDLQIPFTPNDLPLQAGQSVWLTTPAGNLTLASVGSIVTGTGTITLQAGGTVTTDVGTQLTGSIVNVSSASIVSAGNVNGGAITATGTTGINITGGVISGDSVTLAAPTITSAGALSGITAINATATGALNITGGSFTAPAINLQGSSVTSNGALTGGPVNATATGGNVSLSQAPSIVLGQLSGTGVTVVSSGGAIVDGNAGVNVVGTSAGLVAAAGIGSFADPLETQVGTLGLSSGSGEIGIINTGNLVLSGLTLTGPGVAAVGTSGTLTVAGAASSGGDLLLTANGNLTVNQNVSAVGTAEFDSLANIDIKPTSSAVTVSGNTVLLIASGDVNVGNATAAQATNVTAGDLVSVSAGGNFAVRGGSVTGASASVMGNGTGVGVSTIGDVIVAGGSGSGAYAKVIGTNTAMVVGGTVQMTAGTGSGAFASIESVSPTTIFLDFPNNTTGDGTTDFSVGGVTGAIVDTAGTSGFFAGGSPAVLSVNLLVTPSGIVPPPLPPPPTEAPPAVEEVINQVVASTNQQTDDQPVVTTTDPKEGEKDKKEMPVCK